MALFSTECGTDVDEQSEMIVFESILTTFELSIVFKGSWGTSEYWLEPKIQHISKFNLPKSALLVIFTLIFGP